MNLNLLSVVPKNDLPCDSDLNWQGPLSLVPVITVA
jgi:hypothetical protein